jgi:methylated-DNA-protein-cysteine methyltransferase-like protein
VKPTRLAKAPAARRRRTAYDRIWDAVRRIPRGRVASYGLVASVAGLEGRARLAGYALYASPPDAVPWHRVVNGQGLLSLASLDPDGALTQRMRLEREGVRFDARGRVLMREFAWTPSKRRPSKGRVAKPRVRT